MEQIKVLMAEDEPEILRVMSEQISDQGFTVVTAIDGEDAWEKIQKELPDVVLLDLVMPKMDGYEVLKNIREHPPNN